MVQFSVAANIKIFVIHILTLCSEYISFYFILKTATLKYPIIFFKMAIFYIIITYSYHSDFSTVK